MRCPFCLCGEDKVVDSRVVEDGAAIRRRRSCDGCGRRFTTYERVEEISLVVCKRSGDRVPFERAKLISGIKAALKNRPVDDATIELAALEFEDEFRLLGEECSSNQIGLRVLEWLRETDRVGYMRFASVYKGFEDLHDFEREAVALVKQPIRPGD